MIAKIGVIFAVLCVTALADRNPYRAPQPRPQPRAYTPPQPRPTYQSGGGSFESPKYDFGWAVAEEGNAFNQDESRDGDNTQGSYSVDLPDGRRQTVTYYVDGESGFVAEVNYDGEARFPASREYSAPRPAYSPPRTTARPYQPPRTTPRPYQPPRTTPRPYQPPRTTPRPYQPPRTTPRPYQPPRTTRRPYQPPRTTPRPYQPPRNTYQAPRRPSPPRNSYNAPNSLLAAFGF